MFLPTVIYLYLVVLVLDDNGRLVSLVEEGLTFGYT